MKLLNEANGKVLQAAIKTAINRHHMLLLKKEHDEHVVSYQILSTQRMKDFFVQAPYGSMFEELNELKDCKSVQLVINNVGSELVAAVKDLKDSLYLVNEALVDYVG